jgi:hypothetical protein
LIFDPHDSSLLGEQTVDTATGQASEWTAYKTSKIVDSIPGNAPAPLSPACVHGGGYSHGPDNGPSVVTGAPVTQ